MFHHATTKCTAAFIQVFDRIVVIDTGTIIINSNTLSLKWLDFGILSGSVILVKCQFDKK